MNTLWGRLVPPPPLTATAPVRLTYDPLTDSLSWT
jgi:hypothetical protein